jgi:hypothetical protein
MHDAERKRNKANYPRQHSVQDRVSHERLPSGEAATIERYRQVPKQHRALGSPPNPFYRPFTGWHISSWTTKQRQEKEIRQANEQVAALVRTAEGDLDKGNLDKAESELQQVTLVAMATDTQAVGLLQGKIQTARQQAAANKANRKVLEFVRLAEADFLAGDLEAAEAKLTTALAVQGATEMAKAKELLAKIPARRQELANEKVTKLMADATESLKAGDFSKALQTVNEGIMVKDATNTKDAEQLLEKIGDARPELLARDAMQAIQQRHYSIGVKRLKAYLANPRSVKKPVATQVLKFRPLDIGPLQDDRFFGLNCQAEA